GDARARLRADRERLVLGRAPADPGAPDVERSPARPAGRLQDAVVQARRRRDHAQPDPARPHRHRPDQAPPRLDRAGPGGGARGGPGGPARHCGGDRGRGGVPVLRARELHHRAGAARRRRARGLHMSSAPAPTAPGVTFEVERFEWAADDRIEVVGRWFGLRGHRFLRPTLDVEVGGERRRMLAVLEHKPWAADEGEEWVAAFAWTGQRAPLDDAELTVSPDLAVQLPLPDADEAAAEPLVASA